MTIIKFPERNASNGHLADMGATKNEKDAEASQRHAYASKVMMEVARMVAVGEATDAVVIVQRRDGSVVRVPVVAAALVAAS